MTGIFDVLLVGDRGYACQRFLLTLYPDPQTRPQNRFNVALSKTRVKIEMTYGILKACFNCLRWLRVSAGITDSGCMCHSAQYSHYQKGASTTTKSASPRWNWPHHTWPPSWRSCQRCNHHTIFYLIKAHWNCRLVSNGFIIDVAREREIEKDALISIECSY